MNNKKIIIITIIVITILGFGVLFRYQSKHKEMSLPEPSLFEQTYPAEEYPFEISGMDGEELEDEYDEKANPQMLVILDNNSNVFKDIYPNFDEQWKIREGLYNYVILELKKNKEELGHFYIEENSYQYIADTDGITYNRIIVFSENDDTFKVECFINEKDINDMKFGIIQ